MRRLTILLLATLAASCGVAAAQPSGNQVPQPLPVTKYTVGLATIGDADSSDGISSSGVFNVGAGESPAAILQQAVTFSNSLHFLRGTYVFTAPWTSGRSNLTITADPGARFEVDHSGAVGLFSFSGANVTLDGLYVVIDEAVNDQRMVVVSGRRPIVRNCTFDVTTEDGSDANPMKLIVSDNAEAPLIAWNTIYPNAGVDCIDINSSSALTTKGAPALQVIGNRIMEPSAEGFSLTEHPIYPNGSTVDLDDVQWGRLCHGGIRVIGSGYMQVTDNILFALGKIYTTDAHPGPYADGEEFPLAWAIRVQKTGIAPGNETGHVIVSRNIVELTCVPRMMEFWGVGTGVVSDNLLGYNRSGIFTNSTYAKNPGDGGIFITGYLGVPIGESFGSTGAAFGFASTGLLITGNDIHNYAGDADAAGIYVEDGNEIKIRSNHFNVVLRNGKGIHLARSSAANSLMRSMVIEGNDFDGSSSTSAAVHVDDATGWIRRGLVVSNNVVNGFSGGTGGILVPQLEVTGLSLTFAVSGGTTTVTRGSGDWAADGFETGDKISVYGMAGATNNVENRTMTITGATTFTMPTAGATHTAPTSVSAACVNEGPTASCIVTHFITGKRSVVGNVDALTP